MNKELRFEAHIVGYEGTDLSRAPKPYFINEISCSTQGFSTIATMEADSLEEAYRQFEVGIGWAEQQLAVRPRFGVHVKLEAMKEQRIVDKPLLKALPKVRSGQFAYMKSPLVSAWDVHLDGVFDKRLKDHLHAEGYIILDYVSSYGKVCTALTMHFLRPEECVAEYQRAVEAVDSAGGFSGSIYYEDPLAFVVYGETIPRPIVQSMK